MDPCLAVLGEHTHLLAVHATLESGSTTQDEGKRFKVTEWCRRPSVVGNLITNGAVRQVVSYDRTIVTTTSAYNTAARQVMYVMITI